MGLRQRLERFDGRHPRVKWGLLVFALLASAVSLLFGHGDQPRLATAADGEGWRRLVFGCTSCGHEWRYANVEKFCEALDDATRGLDLPPSFPLPLLACPKCGEAAGEVETACVACGRYFLFTNALRVTGKERRLTCPHCGNESAWAGPG